MHQYSQAINELTRVGTAPSPEVLLMTSCLFIACENFCSLDAPTTDGLIHLKAGLKILRTLPREALIPECTGAPTDNLIGNYLAPMLGQVEFGMSMFNTPRSLLLPRTSESLDAPPLLSKPPRLPAHFSDLANAQHHFVELCRWRFHTCLDMRVRPACPCSPSTNSPHAPTKHRHPWTKSSGCFTYFLELLEQWHNLLRSYRDSLPPDNGPEKIRAGVMLRQYRMLYLAFHYSADTESESEDKYDENNRIEGITPLLTDLSDPLQLRVEIGLSKSEWSMHTQTESRTEADEPDVGASTIPGQHARTPSRRWTQRHKIQPDHHAKRRQQYKP